MIKKSLLILILFLIPCISIAQPWDDYIYTQEVTFSSTGTNAYTSDLGELDVGDGALILWYVTEASASTDYDIYFFTQDNGTWSSMINTDEQIYTKNAITSVWSKDDIIFPFTSTERKRIMYVGIYNDDNVNASTFAVRVFFKLRNGSNLPIDVR